MCCRDMGLVPRTWDSPRDSPVRVGVSPTTTIPQVFTARGVEAVFPVLEPWVAQFVSLPSCSSSLSTSKYGKSCSQGLGMNPIRQLWPCPTPVHRHLAVSPLCPCCLSLLLLVWHEYFFFNSLVVRLPCCSIF